VGLFVDLTLVIPVGIAAGLGAAGYLARDVLRRDTGTDRMREIAAAIQEGARAFLRRQYRTIAIIAVVLAILLAVSIGATGGLDFGLRTGGAFGLGAFLSALSGYIGMQISIRSNSRSAAGSLRSVNDALVIALRGGAVSGLAIVALATAHPAKFPDAVERATGVRPALPDRLAGLFDRPERVEVLPNDLAAVQGFIRDTVAMRGAA